MKLISVVTPCFNEEKSIGICHERIKSIFKEYKDKYKYEHIICDNNSTDSTFEKLREIAKLDKNVKVIRNNDGEKVIHNIDLTNTSFLESDLYQILPGDIIIVNPNSTEVKRAGIIGNSGTLLSLLSFILSSIIVISNNN